MTRLADRIEPWRLRALGWWGEREPRERVLLGVLGALVALTLLMLLVVRPLQAARAAALADIRTYETLSGRIRAAGPDLGRGGVTRAGPATAVVTASAGEFGITVQRLEPEGARLRVGIAEAPFDAIVRWLADLERTSAVRLVEVKLDRRPTPGTVAAELLLTDQ